MWHSCPHEKKRKRNQFCNLVRPSKKGAFASSLALTSLDTKTHGTREAVVFTFCGSWTCLAQREHSEPAPYFPLSEQAVTYLPAPNHNHAHRQNSNFPRLFARYKLCVPAEPGVSLASLPFTNQRTEPTPSSFLEKCSRFFRTRINDLDHTDPG